MSNHKVNEIIIVNKNNFTFGFKLNLSSNNPIKKIRIVDKKKLKIKSLAKIKFNTLSSLNSPNKI